MKFYVFLLLIFSYTANAGVVLDSITQSELDGITDDISGLFLYSTGSHGNTIAPGWSGELGVMGGVGKVPEFEKIVGETEDGSVPLVLPTGYFIFGLSTPIGLTVDFNWRPDILQLENVGSKYYGAGLRYSMLKNHGKGLNIEPSLYWSQAENFFQQDLNSVKSDVTMDRTTIGAGLTVGYEISWFRPYVYAGYADSELTIESTNSASVFDTSLTTNGKAYSERGSSVLRAGINLGFGAGNAGFEFQKAFETTRIMFKFASGGNDWGFGID